MCMPVNNSTVYFYTKLTIQMLLVPMTSMNSVIVVFVTHQKPQKKKIRADAL